MENLLTLLLRCKNIIQYLVTLSGALSVASCGINLGWTSPYFPQILNGNSTGINMTSSEGFWCAVMPLIGAPIGSIFAAIFVDRIGRKYTALVLALITFSMFLILGFAKSAIVICLSRLLIGSVEGGLNTILPMYYGEIAIPAIRGTLIATIEVATLSGMLLINVLGIYYSVFTTSIITCIIATVHLLTFICVPESPCYLIKKGQDEKAKECLRILRRSDNIDDEYTSLKESVSRQENDTPGKITDLWSVISNRNAVFICLVLSLTQKYSGNIPILFYTTMIFQATEGSINPQLSVLIYIGVQLLATIVGLFIADRMERKPVTCLSTIGCCVALAFTGLYFFLKEGNYSYVEKSGWIPFATLLLFNICYSVGLELAPTAYLSELFPTNIKATAMGLVDAFSYLNGGIAVILFQLLVDFKGMWLAFGVFSGCCFIGLVFIVLIVPKTLYLIHGRQNETVRDRYTTRESTDL